MSRLRFAACLVAGGKSSRMGSDKAGMPFLGTPLWQHQLETLRQLDATEILISGRREACYSGCGYQIVEDSIIDKGPLSGVVSLLAEVSQPLALMLAIDMPYMTPDHLRILTGQCSENCGVVPVRNDFYEGLAAIFPKATLPIAQEVLGNRDHSMQHFVRECTDRGLVKIVGVGEKDGSLFDSLNAPSDIPGSK